MSKVVYSQRWEWQTIGRFSKFCEHTSGSSYFATLHTHIALARYINELNKLLLSKLIKAVSLIYAPLVVTRKNYCLSVASLVFRFTIGSRAK